MMIWIENAPAFGEDSDSIVTSFIDKIITREKPADNAELLELVNRQIHKHSHTCRKKSKNEAREKILKEILLDQPNKTSQLHPVLNLTVSERTDISLNIRTDDGLTNGAGNIIKLIQTQETGKPSGIIWVQFDCTDVGEKTRHDNRHLYMQGIEPTWTPIKPVSSKFAVGRNRTAQVLGKQFTLRSAAAKTIHRSQGDTVDKIVVNFDSKKAIPHVHYVGLSRVTTIEG